MFNKILKKLEESHRPMVPQNRDYEMTDRERKAIYKELRTAATELSRKLEKYSKDKDFTKSDQEVFSKCENLADQIRQTLFDEE